MPAVVLSPILNGWQGFTIGGLPLSGGFINTYQAGTSTPSATYTTNLGNVANANPIVLGPDGRPPFEIWLIQSQAYRFTVTDSLSNLIATYDNITGIDKGSVGNQTDPAQGAALVGYDGTLAYAPDRSVAWKLKQTVSVLDYIPVSEHAAIKAGTSVLDVSSYFNAAIAAAAVVFVPAGGYFTRFPINMSARRTTFAYAGKRLVGDGINTTIINAYTGVYPCIDCTGQNGGEVSGINFRTDNPGVWGLSVTDCASIGLMQGRGNVQISCNQLLLKNLRFNMASIMARNAGAGTIGICNNAAEHVIRDTCDITANVPLLDHNGLQVTISYSSNIPTIGVNYEQPYAGTPISCTIHENRNMLLIALDSFRAVWFWQVANSEFHNLYTSTRTFTPPVTPAYAETFYLSGSCANVKAHCYQEVSGLFGATYRMDHAYVTIDSGDYANLDFVIQRGALDMGFNLPGAATAALRLLTGPTVHNSKFNCNYLIGIYNASGDNNGFTAAPITFTGTPTLRNLDLVTDQSGAAPRTGSIFSTFGQYCFNVNNRNYRSGDTRRCDSANGSGNSFTPVAVGLTTAGVGTYTFRVGYFERSGGWCDFMLVMTWTAHTGTGGLAITGLPYTADGNANQMVPVYFDALTVDAGIYQAVGWIPNGGTTIQIRKCAVGGTAALQVQMDGVVPELTITGRYKVAD